MPRDAVLVAVLVAALVGVTPGLTLSVAAQDATPVGMATPNPRECRIPPRTIESLAALLDAPEQTGDAAPVDSEATEGEPADAETVARVTETVRELFACQNDNDFLRVFAFFTDDYLRRSFAAAGTTQEDLDFFAVATGALAPEERQAVAVRAVRVLPDGRVRALVVGRNPAADPPEFADFTIFVEQDGRYLIDDVVSQQVGTPTP